jgi:hypothetical protein
VSSLLALTLRQIEARLEKLLTKHPEARALAVHSPVRAISQDAVMCRGRPFRIAWCPTALDFRDQLVALEDAEDACVVILTPLDEDALGYDVLARLPHCRLYRTSRWDSIRTAFSARGIDPRLRGYDWLVDLLLERPPPNGYPPAPSGILDLDTAWREVLSQFLGLQEGRVDAADLLTWTLDATKLERFAALTPAARERIAEQLGAKGGSAVGLIVSAVIAGRGADAMALGLVCTVVFATDQADGVLSDAAIRLEPFFGGHTVSAEAGTPLADAARRVADRLAREPSRTGRHQHDRAAVLLSDIRAAGHAGRSRVLVAGFEARLAAASSALLEWALSGSAEDRDCASTAVSAALAHDRAEDEPRRKVRLEMAARLCRWLAKAHRPARDFASAAQEYAVETSYVDWARNALRGGDPATEVAAAYSRLLELVMVRREEENECFAALFRDWNASGSRGESVIRIEQVLTELVGPLMAEAPVLLLVLDGLSFPVNRALCADLARQGWHQMVPEGRTALRPAIAALPTVTDVSRTSLLTGTLARGTAATERAGFAIQPALKEKSQVTKPPVLFHKADLGAGREVPDAVRDALADSGRKVVGLVHNAVDAQLAGSDQVDFDWTLEVLSQVSSYLRIARDSGRAVVVVGDHGHVLDWGTAQRRAEGGDRWRAAGGTIAGDELQFQGGRVRPADESTTVVMTWSEKVRYSGKHNGYHGGASPAEVVVPIAVLVAGQPPNHWIEAPPSEPSWWLDEPVGRASNSITVPAISLNRSADTAASQVDRQPRSPNRQGWINDLFASPIYGAQRRLTGRGAPSDELIRRVLKALDGRDGRLGTVALAQLLGVSAVRMPALVNAARRVLNVDDAQVLSLDPVTGDAFLDLPLLKSRFNLQDQ